MYKWIYECIYGWLIRNAQVSYWHRLCSRLRYDCDDDHDDDCGCSCDDSDDDHDDGKEWRYLSPSCRCIDEYNDDDDTFIYYRKCRNRCLGLAIQARAQCWCWWSYLHLQSRRIIHQDTQRLSRPVECVRTMFVWICVLCKTWLGTCTAVMMIMIMILLMIIMILLMMIMILLMMIMILLMMMMIMILMQWSHPSPLIYPSISSHPSTSPISSAYPSHVSTYLIHPSHPSIHPSSLCRF